MDRGTSSVLATESTTAGVGGSTDGEGSGRMSRRLRSTLVGLMDSCALAAVALLACLALIAVGAVTSLAWTFVAER